MNRILHNAKPVGIDVGSKAADFQAWIAQLIEKNNATKGHHCINTTITGGEGQRGLQTPTQQNPNIFMRVTPVTPNSSSITTIIAKSTRRNEHSPLSQIKSLNYGDNILATREAEAANADDAIMLNTQGNAACFTIGNLFILKDGQLMTPPLTDGAMNGIIRKKWIERANITERSITQTDLKTAEAIFRTNSIRGITPVGTLNGKTLPPPPITIDHTLHLF